MAYFAQFLRPSTSREAEVDPVVEFETLWISVKATLERPDERQLARGIHHTNVANHLRSMADTLVREAGSVEEDATGGCLEFLLKYDVLGDLVGLSEIDRPFGIQAEVLRMIIQLVSSLDEQFLVHSAVHKAVIRLLRICVGDETEEPLDGSRPMGAAGASLHSDPSEYELELVDLLCTLCTRIRTYPDLLLIFLHDKNWYRAPPTSMIYNDEEEEREEERDFLPSSSVSPRPISPALSSASTITSAPSATPRKKPEHEFLIFNYLLRFVHREGKIGELGRGGILSLIDVAMTAGETGGHTDANASTATDPVGEAALALAEYILDGDFSDVLCAGLGAVYSELPTKLEVCHQIDESSREGMLLGGLSDEERAARQAKHDDAHAARTGIIYSTDPIFRSRLDNFLKLLEFVQDVLLRMCGRMDDPLRKTFAPSALVGSAVTQTVMETFRTTFLKNVLYPSILECSDSDGSSVAVLIYIDEMIRALTEASLADLVIAFLMSEDDDDDSHPRLRRQVRERVLDGTKLSRRTKVNRRKSRAMILLEAARHGEDPDYFSSLGRFTLKDLLVQNLKSSVNASAAAALRLLQSLFRDHCHMTIDFLLTVTRDEHATNFVSTLQPSVLGRSPFPLSLPHPDSPFSHDNESFAYPGAADNPDSPDAEYEYALSRFREPDTTYADHIEEIDLYLVLVNRVVPARQGYVLSAISSALDDSDQASFSTSYKNYINDAITAVQSQSCFVDDDASALSMPRHCLLPTDALLGALLQSLRLFFSHTPEHNLELTGVLSRISTCPHRSMAGWLTMGDPNGLAGELEWPAETKKPIRFAAESGDETYSVDREINQLLRSGMKRSARRKKDDGSRLPVVYVLLSGLVAQLERYRRTVDDFDRYLEERRQGLLFTENISDALALDLHFEMSSDRDREQDMVIQPRQTRAPPNTPAHTKAKPKSKGALASVTAYFTPTKPSSSQSKSTISTRSSANSSPPSAAVSSEAVTPSRGARTSPNKTFATPRHSSRSSAAIPSSPFSSHYTQTSAIDVEPYVAPAPSVGPWSPAKHSAFEKDNSFLSSSLASFGAGFRNERDDVDVDVFSAAAPAPSTSVGAELRAVARVTLSRLLDNVVILEEFMKELAAIIQVRRSLGIDALRYV